MLVAAVWLTRRFDQESIWQFPATLLSFGLLIWLIIAGLVIATGTLGVISWGQQAHGLVVARTMGLVTLSLFNLFFSIEVKDERKTVFSLDTFSDHTFVLSTGLSVLTIILATVFGPLQKFLETTSLDVQQWLICIAVALSIIVIAEIRKAFLRRSPGPVAQVEAPVPQAAAVAA